jgi:hypothetical protein
MKKMVLVFGGAAMLYCFAQAVSAENISAMWGWVTALLYAALLFRAESRQMQERIVVMKLVAPLRAFMRVHKGVLPEGVSPNDFMKELDAVMRGDVALFMDEEKVDGPK